LLNQEEFTSAVGADWQHAPLFPFFRLLWERARKEVLAADKISFVGMSLSPYLESGLKFLFSGKRGDVQLVVANPDVERFSNLENHLHPNSPAGRAFEIMTRCGFDGRVFGSYSEYDGCIRFKDFETEDHETTVTSHRTFRDFIESEL
jgi:hypothetical protein